MPRRGLLFKFSQNASDQVALSVLIFIVGRNKPSSPMVLPALKSSEILLPETFRKRCPFCHRLGLGGKLADPIRSRLLVGRLTPAIKSTVEKIPLEFFWARTLWPASLTNPTIKGAAFAFPRRTHAIAETKRNRFLCAGQRRDRPCKRLRHRSGDRFPSSYSQYLSSVRDP